MSYVLPKAVIAAMLVGGMAMPASAAMTVGTFLARANALRDQGPMALMSPDFPALKAEAKAATTQLKAERAARAAAGKPPIACVPGGSRWESWTCSTACRVCRRVIRSGR
ncbi:hypothetical protein QTN93_14515 [Sphingomonas aerolata]|uniref:hypothetical protein n=1 Tax=Sphingomonas aerolata TaxID=185951 RepID=UPI0035A70EB5